MADRERKQYVTEYVPIAQRPGISTYTECKLLNREQKAQRLKDLVDSKDYKSLLDTQSFGGVMTVKKGGGAGPFTILQSQKHAFADWGPQVVHDMFCAAKQIAADYEALSRVERACQEEKAKIEAQVQSLLR